MAQPASLKARAVRVAGRGSGHSNGGALPLVPGVMCGVPRLRRQDRVTAASWRFRNVRVNENFYLRRVIKKWVTGLRWTSVRLPLRRMMLTPSLDVAKRILPPDLMRG